jgi:hypothetical protein
MTALNLDSFEAALKVHYTDLRVKNLVYRNNPFLAAVPKYEYFGGKNLPIPVQFGTPQGRSATFTDANAPAVQTPGEYTDYVLKRVRNYSIAAIDNETLEASVGRPNAFMEAAASEIDGALRSLTQDLAGNLYRDQFGIRGEVANIVVNEITLTNPSDIVAFEVGMTLVSVAAATPAAATTGGGVGTTIDSINRDNGTFTVTALGAPPIAIGDVLFQLGDAQNGGVVPLKMAGLAGWLPAVPPAPGDDFFGVDRSIDSSRLAGQRYDGTAETIEEALIGAGSLLFREGGRPDLVFMNPLSYSELIKSLGSKVVYDVVRSSDVAEVFFDSVKVYTPSGQVSVVADPNCPTGVAYMVQMDTWKLYSLGMAPKILMTDGLRFLRTENADSVTVRCGYYSQLGNVAPGWNARIALAT